MNKDDIKKALEVCTDCYSTCDDCPYDDVGNCGDTLKTDACELIIKQEQEINQVKTECTLLDDELRNARQETINVLNKVKEKLNNTPNGWAYTTYIDELIKEYE